MRSLASCLLMSVVILHAQTGIEGTWQGELKLPNASLRLRMKIDPDAAGWKGTLDSLDQGALGIPLQDVQFAEGKLSWKVTSLRAEFTGTLNDSQDVITGQFSQGGASLPLELKRLVAGAAVASAPRRPQTPKEPFPYRAERVTFPSKARDVNLAGTLTVPTGRGPHPAVVLVSGSGAQDRDETLFDHKPFAVIADYLGRQGIAVLRYDDRGVGESTGQFSGATTADFALDAEGAFEYLLRRSEVSPVGIGGHSEGGLIAPMIAARRREVQFVVMLAGTGVNGEQVLLRQAAAILQSNGAPPEVVEANRKVQQTLFAISRTTDSRDETLRKVRAELGSSPAIDQQARTISDPWFRSFLDLDPAPILASVSCPALVLNGDLDTQVVAEQNVPVIEAALREGGNTQVTSIRFPQLNHLFQTATTGAPNEYAQIEETISPAVLETISAWIKNVAMSTPTR